MRIIHTIAEMQSTSVILKKNGTTIGFVPTMGALHEGHGSLIRASHAVHNATVVSVFVNPTQFGPNEDYTQYPRTLEDDVVLAERFGASHIFAPSVQEMYPNGFATSVNIGAIATMFEGAIRPGHFEGVATVVAKLLNAVLPDNAYFGQKDYQQTIVIKRMASDLNIPVNIIVQPTLRELNGLAMSSRNRYLSTDERSTASAIYRALQAGKQCVEGGIRMRAEIERTLRDELGAFTVDYASIADADTLVSPEIFEPQTSAVLLVAARLGTTRLIDNELVTIR